MNLEFIKNIVDKAGGLENIISEGAKLASNLFSGNNNHENEEENAKEENIISKGVLIASNLLSKDKDEIESVDIEQGADLLDISKEDFAELKPISELSENMSDEEEQQFLENQYNNLMSAQDVQEALMVLNKEVLETIKFCEVQKTKREKIRAESNVKLAQINSVTECIKDYLNRSFDERGKLFDNYFNVLDKAIEGDNLELMAATLQSINSLAASSPFKDLNDIGKVTQNLSTGGEWDI